MADEQHTTAAVQQFLDNLKVNEKVITTGGIYGQITRLSEQTVQLQVADKVRIEVARACPVLQWSGDRFPAFARQ